MNFLVIGAGGIGAYYGARLLAAGHAVTFVARGAHGDALRANGLRVEHPQFQWQGRVDVRTLETLGDIDPMSVDAVLVCVKAMATAEVARALAGWAGEVPVVVASLQNGVDNEAELAAALGPGRVLGGLARRIGGHVVAPGHVQATGIAEVILGPWPNNGAAGDPALASCSTAIVAALAAAGLPATGTDAIDRELWRKLILNNGMNPLSALVRYDTRRITNDPHLGPVARAMMRETALAAAGDGVTITQAEADEMFELIRHFDPIKTSMLIDLEAGRALEIDAIPGAVLRRARRLGIAVPYTETVHALLTATVGGG